MSEPCCCVWTYRRRRGHARRAPQVSHRAARHKSSSLGSELAVGVSISAHVLKHRQHVQKALCTWMQDRLYPAGRKNVTSFCKNEGTDLLMFFRWSESESKDEEGDVMAETVEWIIKSEEINSSLFAAVSEKYASWKWCSFTITASPGISSWVLSPFLSWEKNVYWEKDDSHSCLSVHVTKKKKLTWERSTRSRGDMDAVMSSKLFAMFLGRASALRSAFLTGFFSSSSVSPVFLEKKFWLTQSVAWLLTVTNYID